MGHFLFGAQIRKIPQIIEKNWLEKLFELSFPNMKPLIKPIGKQPFEKSRNAIRKPYEKCQMEGIQSKIGKWPPESLKSISFFTIKYMLLRHVAEPYENNGKPTSKTMKQ